MRSPRTKRDMLGIAKAAPGRLRRLTLMHAGSGATKEVEYLGMAGLPLRAQIWWPGAGEYLVSPRSGTLLGERSNAHRRRAWRLTESDRRFLISEWHLARARSPQSAGSRLMGAR